MQPICAAHSLGCSRATRGQRAATGALGSDRASMGGERPEAHPSAPETAETPRSHSSPEVLC